MLKISNLIVDTSNRSREASVEVKGQNLDGILTFSGTSTLPLSMNWASADWALLGLLYPAMSFGEDLQVDGPVSARLLFYLNGDIQRLLQHFNPSLNLIKIVAPLKHDLRLSMRNSVATGFSAGVDSFATLTRYSKKNAPEGLGVNCLSVFDVGAFGKGLRSKDLFQSACRRMVHFAGRNNLDALTLDTNLDSFYSGRDSIFQMTHILRNIAAALFFQDVLSIYHYSSTYPYKELNRGHDDMSYIEAALLPLLSTEMTEMHNAGASLSRLEKTELISDVPETFSSLDICVAKPRKRARVGKTNCSTCWKCSRALIHFEILGALEKYGDVFDLGLYRENREDAVNTVIKSALSGKPADRDLLGLMIESNFQSAALRAYRER